MMTKVILIEAGEAARIDCGRPISGQLTQLRTLREATERDSELVINITNGQQFSSHQRRKFKTNEVTKPFS